MNDMLTLRPNTLSDVLTLLEAEVRLPADKKRNWRSAIKRLADLSGRHVSSIPASVEAVRDLINAVVVPRHVMSAKSWSNLKSSVKAALAFVGVTTKRRKRYTDMLPEWQVLRDVAHERKLFPRISAFMHYCSECGVLPKLATQQTFEAFRAELLATRIGGDPEKVYANTVGCWNKLRGSDRSWPDLLVERETRRDWYSLPMDAFPTGFVMELDATLERLTKVDFFDDTGPTKPWAPSSLSTLRSQIHRLASAMVLSGRPIEEIDHLTRLLDKDWFKEAIVWTLENRFGWTDGDLIPPGVIEQAKAIRGRGRHWLLQAGQDMEFVQRHMDSLKYFTDKLGTRRWGMTQKNRDCLRQFDDPKTELALLALPETLMAEAKSMKKVNAKAARLVQTAIAFGILLAGAPRLSNLLNINTRRHLKYSNANPVKPVSTVMLEDEVKNEMILEIPFGEPLRSWISLYQTVYLPVLASPNCPFFFPGQDPSKPKTTAAFRSQIKRALLKYAGIQMTPHQFRHFLAAMVLKNEPGNFGLAQQILGHKDINTTIRFYAELNYPPAVAAYQRMLEENYLEPSRQNRSRRKR
jgi:site-specific recombinase XerC